jgi:hypothetical protein
MKKKIYAQKTGFLVIYENFFLATEKCVLGKLATVPVANLHHYFMDAIHPHHLLRCRLATSKLLSNFYSRQGFTIKQKKFTVANILSISDPQKTPPPWYIQSPHLPSGRLTTGRCGR